VKGQPLPLRWLWHVYRYPGVSPAEMALVVALFMHMDNESGETSEASLARLCAVSRLSKTAVRDNLTSLEGKGLIDRHRQRLTPILHDTTIYTPLFPEIPALPDNVRELGVERQTPKG
jgi:hypothetical protein